MDIWVHEWHKLNEKTEGKNCKNECGMLKVVSWCSNLKN